MATTNNYFGFPVTPTRYENLGFGSQRPGDWRFFDISGPKPAWTGPIYKTKAELLADLPRFGQQWAG